MSESCKKYLIVGPSWVGDMVMAQTLFKRIKQKEPNAIIDVLAPGHSGPLLARMPEVRQHLPMPFKHGELKLLMRYRIGRDLRKEQYTQAIVLPNSFKSALIPLWAKIPLRTGWLGEMRFGLLNDYRQLDKNNYPLMIERFVALALAPGASIGKIEHPRLKANIQNAEQTCQELGLVYDRKPILALCPGAEFGPAKRWPARHYAQVAREKIKAGYDIWIFGSDKESPVACEIQAEINNQAVDLTGKTSLAQAIDLMSLAQAVVSNDSGLMHIAASLGKKLVVVYGSSSPKFTPPLSQAVKIIQLGLSCSPCFKRKCPLGHLNCLNELLPISVLNALTELGA